MSTVMRWSTQMDNWRKLQVMLSWQGDTRHLWNWCRSCLKNARSTVIYTIFDTNGKEASCEKWKYRLIWIYYFFFSLFMTYQLPPNKYHRACWPKWYPVSLVISNSGFEPLYLHKKLLSKKKKLPPDKLEQKLYK